MAGRPSSSGDDLNDGRTEEPDGGPADVLDDADPLDVAEVEELEEGDSYDGDEIDGEVADSEVDPELAEDGLDELDEGRIAAAVAAGTFETDAVAGAPDDEDESEQVEGVRDGEFVCRSCNLARRETQLADADALLCLDCG